MHFLLLQCLLACLFEEAYLVSTFCTGIEFVMKVLGMNSVSEDLYIKNAVLK